MRFRLLTRSATAIVATALAAAITFVGPVPLGHAARSGRIEGRVLNGTTGDPQPGVKVILLVSSQQGTKKEAARTTGRDGTYSFDNLPTGRDYALDAVFDGGTFAGGAISLPSDTTKAPVFQTTLRVWPTTSDPSAIEIIRDDLFVVPNANNAGVIESVRFVNISDKAYIGRAAQFGKDGRESPTVGFALPAGADAAGVQIIGSDIDIPLLVHTDFGFAATVAFPPDEHQVTFSYQVPDSTGSHELSRNVLYPTAEVTIFAAPPLTVQSNRLHAAGTENIKGQSYGRWTTSTALEAGDPVQALAVAEGSISPGLVGGIAGVVALLLLGGWLLYARRRRDVSTPGTTDAGDPGGETSGQRQTTSPVIEAPQVEGLSRQQLLTAIAELDVKRAREEIDEAEWQRQRTSLKQLLINATRDPSL